MKASTHIGRTWICIYLRQPCPALKRVQDNQKYDNTNYALLFMCGVHRYRVLSSLYLSLLGFPTRFALRSGIGSHSIRDSRRVWQKPSLWAPGESAAYIALPDHNSALLARDKHSNLTPNSKNSTTRFRMFHDSTVHQHPLMTHSPHQSPPQVHEFWSATWSSTPIGTRLVMSYGTIHTT